MDRRTFLAGTGGVLLAGPRAVEAQRAPKVWRIGFLGTRTAADTAPLIDAFREGLRELGWTESQNIVIEFRFGDGKLDRLPNLASDLVQLKSDVIVAQNTPGVAAAKNATGTTPIVMIFVTDPVASGFIVSLARPGGNITGLAGNAGLEIYGKELALLKETVPGLRRVAILSNPDNPSQGISEINIAARSLDVQLQALEARGPNEFEAAFAAMAKERVGAVLVVADTIFFLHRTRLAELAARTRLPSMYAFRVHVEAGGLMSYGPNVSASYRRAAYYVDKILKGAKPSDLPVEQPTTFELVINAKTAKALGLTIPPLLLARADQVIE